MKAAVIKGAGEVPVYGDFDEPVVAGNRQLVELVAAGLHPVVRALAGGDHYGSTGPGRWFPGVDAVARTDDGRLVYTGFTEHPYGTFAERMSVPMTLPLPDGADPVQIAGGLNPGLSSWLPLRARRRPTARLGTVLVLGATGVAGTIAVQNALALGAEHVVAVGRNRRGAGSTGPGERDHRSADRPRRRRLPRSLRRGDRRRSGRPSCSTSSGADRPSSPSRPSPAPGWTRTSAAACTSRSARPPARPRRSRPRCCGAPRSRSGDRGPVRRRSSDLIAELPIFMAKIADGSIRVPVATYPLADVSRGVAGGARGERVVLTA